MIWTFCPSCSARIAWGPTCPACGARIPAYDAASGQTSGPEPQGGGARASTREYGQPSGLAHRLALVMILAGLVVTAALLIRYAVSGSEAPDSSGNRESAVTAESTPPRITALSVSGITGTGATISWATDKASSSQVQYFDTASQQAGSAVDPALGTSHSVVLETLQPGVTYRLAAWSTDERGNRSGSAEAMFNTPLPGAGGSLHTGSVFFHQSQVLGTDKKPIELVNNAAAVDVSRAYLLQFLLEDGTDRIPYVEGSFDCSEFAETLHNNAERAGIRASYVCLGFAGSSWGHAINAFQTTDAGLIFVDCTGQPVAHACSLDATAQVVVGEQYAPSLVWPCPYIVGLAPLGTVTDISITW